MKKHQEPERRGTPMDGGLKKSGREGILLLYRGVTPPKATQVAEGLHRINHGATWARGRAQEATVSAWARSDPDGFGPC
jgi:hypothetical protein